MRLMIYGSFLILCCALIHTSSAENRNYKRWRGNEDNSAERPSNYRGDKKYKTKYRTDSDDSEEDFKISRRYDKKTREESGSTSEKKFSKYAKEANRFVDHEEQPQSYKKNKKNYDARRDRDSEGSGRRFEKKKPFVAEDDSDEESIEDFIPSKKQIRKDNKDKHSRFVKSKIEEENSAEVIKNKKYSNKRTRNIKNDDDETSEEETVKFEKFTRKTGKPLDDSDEEPDEEAPKKQFRKKIRVRIPDSPEDDSDESDEDNGTCKKRSKKGRSQKNCLDEESVNGDGEAEQPKKIRYSIKFAHEKEKISPSEDDNIMKKIHRGEKKKYRYEDDDDDDSSEEHTHPKRLHFADDDEE